MSHYKENLHFFEKKAPLLFNALTQEKIQAPVELNYDDNFKQYKIVKNNKSCYLNSVFDTENEYLELTKNIDSNVEVIVLVGFGDGTFIEYIKKQNLKLKHFIIVEPYLDVFKLFIENYSIQKIFKEMGNISLVVNKTPVEANEMIFDLLKNGSNKINVVCQISYFQLDQSYVKQLSDLMMIGFRSQLSSVSTLNAMRNRWLLNTIYNLKQLDVQQELIGDSLKGKPAIIVSAGPSLNKQLPMLNEIKNKAVLIAAGSAIKILSKNGIKPHFRMAIDADGDADLYDDKFYEEASEIPLLYANQLNYDILPRYNGHKMFMILPTDLIGRYMYEKYNIDCKIIASGASVVHSALSFLSQSGCEPIVFIGQDMCFYDDNLYASGRDVGNIKGYHPQSLIKQVDINGKEVYTLRNYLQIKYDYDTLVKSYDNHLINATEAGLGIEGVENIPLGEVRDQYFKEDINLDINQIINEKKEEHSISQEVVTKFIDEIYDEAKEIIKICEERRNKIQKLQKNVNNRKKMGKLKEELEYLDRDYEAILTKVGFYDKVVRMSISTEVLSAKQLIDTSINKNTYEYTQMGISYLNSITSEIEIYSELTKEWIEEVFYNEMKDKEGDSENAQ